MKSIHSDMASKDKLFEFWHWFKKNHHKYLFIKDVSEREKDKLMNELLIELHKYCDGLFFEIGGHNEDPKIELVITAEGVLEYFPNVEELIDNAPDLEEWKFVKFRPAHGVGFSTKYQGKVFSPEKTIFIPLFNQSDPSAIGIQVCYPDYNTEEHDVFINGTYIMLDTLIGEKSTTLDIDYIEITSTPKNIGEYNFMHLSELGQYIVNQRENKN